MYTPADIYSCSRTENNRMPDVRNTLYWNPGVQLKEGKSENFTFYTADTPGEYIAIIESIDEKGKEIRDFCTFMVKWFDEKNSGLNLVEILSEHLY